ncbi:cytochrome c biogenesis protein CcmE, partial [Salmonella enterica subsp. enterica]|nr:cytochrome c biogenesis protein CcmE [Salmonella enterica subsp. enterica]
KRETQQLPGITIPPTRRRDPDSLKVNFSLYDAEGSVTVSYEGILPDLFREGQGVVVQGTLEKGNHVLAHEVLAKHDENYTPPEVEKAMQENHRRPQRADKDTSS